MPIYSFYDHGKTVHRVGLEEIDGKDTQCGPLKLFPALRGLPASGIWDQTKDQTVMSAPESLDPGKGMKWSKW
jgi:hypothetical protein